MRELVTATRNPAEVPKKKYEFIGREGDHIHAQPFTKNVDGKDVPDLERAGRGETQRFVLEPGDVIELTETQYKAASDRFLPVDDEDRQDVKRSLRRRAPRNTGLLAEDNFDPRSNPATVPVNQDVSGGNLIRETDVIEDPEAGPHAFKGAGQITADHAKLAKQLQDEEDADLKHAEELRRNKASKETSKEAASGPQPQLAGSQPQK